jgi:rod shape-determining protein MreD
VTQEASVARKALAAVILAAALSAAVVVQLTVVNRLPLPGVPNTESTGPDLVLLLVTAIAVTTGPVTGALAGFAGGLALDIAPPAAHYAGEYALIFCLAGYAAARVTQIIWGMTGEHDRVTILAVMAAAAAAGEAGKAALGMLLSDPNVTAAAVSWVLPAAVLYDLLLSPLVFWLVLRVTRGTVAWNTGAGSTAAERAPAPEFGRAGQLASVFRQASAGAAPNLRLAGSGENYRSPSPPRRVPRLRLSHASSGASLRTSSASSGGAPLSLAGGRTPRVNFAGDGPARTPRRAVRTPRGNWLQAAAVPSAVAVPAAKRPVRSPGRNWLHTSRTAAAAGPSVLRSSPAKTPSFKQSARPAAKRAARTPGRGWLRSGTGSLGGGVARGLGGPQRGLGGPPRGFMGGTRAGSPIAVRTARSAAEVLAARSAPSGLSALSGAGTPLARRHSPSRGWLRGSGSARPAFSARAFSRQRRAPRSGWLGSAARPRTVIGSGVSGRTGMFRPRVLGGSVLGGSAFRSGVFGGSAFRGRRTARSNWYTASPSGAWLRRGRRPWRRRSYLPGRRPPGYASDGKNRRRAGRSGLLGRPASLSPGARAMAKTATASRMRKPRLFGLLGGHR